MTDDRRLGSSGLTTPPLILGGNVFGWTVDQTASFPILDAFVGGGGRMIDTADTYSRWVPGNRGGEPESIIGAWLAARGRRDAVLIATKVGGEMDGSSRGLAADRISSAVEGSLKRPPLRRRSHWRGWLRSPRSRRRSPAPRTWTRWRSSSVRRD